MARAGARSPDGSVTLMRSWAARVATALSRMEHGNDLPAFFGPVLELV